MGVAGDVARAAGARADIVQRLFHRGDDLGMLTHRQIVVRAPDGDRFRPVVAGKAARVGIGALVAQNVDEDAIPAFLVAAVEDRKSTRLNSSHYCASRMPSPAGQNTHDKNDRPASPDNYHHSRLTYSDSR